MVVVVVVVGVVVVVVVVVGAVVVVVVVDLIGIDPSDTLAGAVQSTFNGPMTFPPSEL